MRTESCLPRRFRRVTMVVFAAAYLIVCTAFSAAVGADAKPAGKYEFDAWTFDRGNASVYANPDRYADYRDKYPNLVVGKGGQLPWFIEYDINFPADTTYTLHIHYGSPQPRGQLPRRGVGKGLPVPGDQGKAHAEVRARGPATSHDSLATGSTVGRKIDRKEIAWRFPQSSLTLSRRRRPF